MALHGDSKTALEFGASHVLLITFADMLEMLKAVRIWRYLDPRTPFLSGILHAAGRMLQVAYVTSAACREVR